MSNMIGDDLSLEELIQVVVVSVVALVSSVLILVKICSN